MMKSILFRHAIAILIVCALPMLATAQADLLLIQNGQTAVYGNQPIYYSLRIINKGPAVATNVTLTDIIPPGLSFQGFVNLSVDIIANTPPIGGTGVITLTFPPIGPGTYNEVLLRLMNNGSIPIGASVTNTASVTSSMIDPVPSDNTASVTTSINPFTQDMAVYKAAQPIIEPGGRIFYSILIVNSNNGPAPVTFTDLLPVGTQFESLGTLPGTATVNVVGRQIIVTLPVLNAARFTITAIVDNAVPVNTVLSNTANITAIAVNNVLTNDQSTANTTVRYNCKVTCPENIEVSSTPGQCGAIVNYNYMIEGTCGGVGASPAPGSFFPIGNTTVNITSAAGEKCSFIVKVNDAEPALFTTCPMVAPFCQNSTGMYTIPAAAATDNCAGAIAFSYTINGATNRSGTGNNASGAFNPGTSFIAWKTVDVNGTVNTACQTVVEVKPSPAVTIPDAYALPAGTAANTVYLGYTPAGTIQLTAVPTGPGPHTYTWSNGSSSPSIRVSPTTTTTYSVGVQNGNGCVATAFKTITVVDARCGNKLDKVQVCQSPPGNPSNANAVCLSANAVASHLAKGSYLGTCNTGLITSAAKKGVGELKPVAPANDFTVQTLGNPASANTVLTTKSNSTQPLQVKVFNALGRLVEVKRNAAANSAIPLGQNYTPGVYYIQVSQGNQSKMIKIVKGTN